MAKLGAKAEQFAEATLDAALALSPTNLDEGPMAMRREAGKVMAIVLEHSYGKPKQRQEFTGADGADLNPFASLPLAELRQRALAAIAAAPQEPTHEAEGSAVHGTGAPTPGE